MFKRCMMKNPWFSFDKKSHKHKKTPNFKDVKIPWKMHERCMKSCNLMKKEGQKCLTLSFWRKPLNLWPRMWQFFIFIFILFYFICEKGSRVESDRETKNNLKSLIWFLYVLKKAKTNQSRGIEKESKCTWK